jgi:hypothetical protein
VAIKRCRWADAGWVRAMGSPEAQYVTVTYWVVADLGEVEVISEVAGFLAQDAKCARTDALQLQQFLLAGRQQFFKACVFRRGNARRARCASPLVGNVGHTR